ncbi:MAG TPA: hypothetical protein VIS96_12330 [Terrimicrobiaceae bacterium]
MAAKYCATFVELTALSSALTAAPGFGAALPLPFSPFLPLAFVLGVSFFSSLLASFLTSGTG